ncbi:hypothetical protein GR183_12725 [Stappia sp. GBMRC 2046]|uniref:Uncharacterized protein n=1 Tax=Stappia sediminis TaxID=2692190 RepID=A0A7X3LVB6_9HYPH|nr:hypothetical protein [Stappia sediminis]MXN65772.1 hypothetical protein [Stappia sediminis]
MFRKTTIADATSIRGYCAGASHDERSDRSRCRVNRFREWDPLRRRWILYRERACY